MVVIATVAAAFLTWISTASASGTIPQDLSGLTSAQKSSMGADFEAWTAGGAVNPAQIAIPGLEEGAVGAGTELGIGTLAGGGAFTAGIPIAVGGIFDSACAALSGVGAVDSCAATRELNPVGGFFYRLFSGDDYTGANSSSDAATVINGMRWEYLASTTSTAWAPVTGPIWVPDLSYSSATCGGGYGCGRDGTAYLCAVGAANCDSAHTGNNGSWIPFASTFIEAQPLISIYNRPTTDLNGGCAWNVHPSSCVSIYRTNAQMNKAIHVHDISLSQFNSLGSTYKTTPSVTAPSHPSNLTDAQLIAALTAIDSATIAAQTAAEAAAVALLRANAGLPDFSAPDCRGLSQSACVSALTALGWTGSSLNVTSTLTYSTADNTKPAAAVVTQAISPGAGMTNGQTFSVTVNPATAEMPMTLPKPYTYEKYADYISRLQAGGWVGTASPVVLSEADTDPCCGPDGVPKLVLQLNGTGSPQVVQTGAWPTTSPSIKRGVSITVYRNPTDAPTAPPNPSDPPNPDPGGVPAPIPPPVDCSTCAIDWTPIEAINYGNKFPFGFFTWIGNFFSSIPTSGSCPNLSIGKPSALGGGTLDISFCSSTWESTWRTPVFLILEALMTLAGVVFLAQRILGFGSDDE